jgi:hypothetical protein
MDSRAIDIQFRMWITKDPGEAQTEEVTNYEEAKYYFQRIGQIHGTFIEYAHVYEGVSKRFRTESITK